MSTSSNTPLDVLNVAAYKFVPLENLESLREQLLERLNALGIKGTILLSTEGLNMFLAGTEESVNAFVDYIRKLEPFSDLEVKQSFSDRQPFNRTLVRLKEEIIAFGVDGIDPLARTSPKLKAEELRKWLDEGKPVTLLDVRNDYEVELGTFENALAIGVDNFRDFPDAVRRLPEETKEAPVVMFCTGGIRCEKAGPFMEREGFEEVYQLDGGILKYFETCGGEHYKGDCFVFDQRVSLDPELQETDTELCYVCQSTLTPQQQQSAEYVPGVSCPHCFKSEETMILEKVAARNRQIAEITNPLPGSFPKDNIRPIAVSEKCSGLSLLELVDSVYPHVGRGVWQQRFDNGLIRENGIPVTAERITVVGERFQNVTPAEIEPDVNASIEVLHEDDLMIVVNKPAPLPMHPSGRFNRNTLTSILSTAYAPHQLRIAHRLDANTTGVVVLARSKAAARQIIPQFETGDVNKTYLARVNGHPKEDRFSCDAKISTSPSQAGLRIVDEAGQQAHTDFEVKERFDDGTSLLIVRPKTGRTNQIRVHLWHLGHSILGDVSYLPNGELGKTQTLAVTSEPMCLHAWKLEFICPTNLKRTEMIAKEPDWAAAATA